MPQKGPSTIDQRLKRIEGQIRGIENMVQNEEDVSQILIQIQAVTSSLDSVRVELIKKEIKGKILENLDSAVNLIK